jgi:hypothetical protein
MTMKTAIKSAPGTPKSHKTNIFPTKAAGKTVATIHITTPVRRTKGTAPRSCKGCATSGLSDLYSEGRCKDDGMGFEQMEDLQLLAEEARGFSRQQLQEGHLCGHAGGGGRRGDGAA